MFLASTRRKWRAPLSCRTHWGSNRHTCMHTNWLVTAMCVSAPSALFTVTVIFFLQFLVFDDCCLDLDNICCFESLLLLGAIHTEHVFALKNARCGQWNGEECKVLRHFLKVEIYRYSWGVDSFLILRTILKLYLYRYLYSFCPWCE